MDEKWQKFVEAVAEYFGCEPAGISGVVLGVEYQKDNSLKFQTAWMGVPWRMHGYVTQTDSDIQADIQAAKDTSDG